MRFGSDVQSNGEFYSDLNGMTHSKRVYYSKLHLQGNVYPIVSSAYLQDSKKRISLLTKQASGTASLQDGQLDVRLIYGPKIPDQKLFFRFGLTVHWHKMTLEVLDNQLLIIYQHFINLD